MKYKRKLVVLKLVCSPALEPFCLLILSTKHTFLPEIDGRTIYRTIVKQRQVMATN
jgi:hypothetical protein